jgi:hypothetical protein
MKSLRHILLIFALLAGFGWAQTTWIRLYLTDSSQDSINVQTIRRFYISDSSAAAVVRLTEPFNGAINVSQLPELSWRVVPGQTYELFLANNPDFNPAHIHMTGLDHNHYQVIDPLDIQTTYYWKVRSSNTAEWSAVWHFTTWVPSPPEPIRAFAVVSSQDPQTLQILLPDSLGIDRIVAYLSSDGVSFSDSVEVDPSDLQIGDLVSDSLYFIRIKAINSAGASPRSEVLAGVPGQTTPRELLIVNGFDRNSTGNTYNFIRQHATAVRASSYGFDSATNEAYTEGLLKLTDYHIVDYILGDESTADETFSNLEQDSVKVLLKQGGKLFVSGSELAWDLDYRGSATDKSFCHDFLKVEYAADAPNNQSGVYYQVEPVTDTFFSSLSSFSFDNGTHGTIDVKWPDVFRASGGGKGVLKYVNYGVSNGYAGITFEGLFPGGHVPGKVLVTGFPFETIYPTEQRNAFMARVLEFFEQETMIEPGEHSELPLDFRLFQNYPNPFNSSTIISYQLPRSCFVRLTVYDLLGEEVLTLINTVQPAGRYQVWLAAESLPSGTYLYVLNAGEFAARAKFCLIK